MPAEKPAEALADMLKQAQDTLSVVRDLALEGDKNTAEQVSQMLLVHAREVLLAAKHIAIPHKIGLTFLNFTLRYPEDCDAGYQLTEEYIQEQLKSDEDWARRYGRNLASQQGTYEAKFLPSAIWDSSNNCSDQGLNMFTNFDDFALDRNDFTWYKSVCAFCQKSDEVPNPDCQGHPQQMR